MAEEDNMAPTERSILPIRMGNVSPDATRRKTVEAARIPVKFLIRAKTGNKTVKTRNTTPKRMYGNITINLSKPKSLMVFLPEIKYSHSFSKICRLHRYFEQPASVDK